MTDPQSTASPEPARHAARRRRRRTARPAGQPAGYRPSGGHRPGDAEPSGRGPDPRSERRTETGRGSPGPDGRAIARTWPGQAALLAAAIGMLGLWRGLLLVWPNATLTVVAILIGAALLVAGVSGCTRASPGRGESGGMRAAYIVIGLLAVIAGLYCLKHHSLTILFRARVRDRGRTSSCTASADLSHGRDGKAPGRGLRGAHSGSSASRPAWSSCSGRRSR